MRDSSCINKTSFGNAGVEKASQNPIRKQHCKEFKPVATHHQMIWNYFLTIKTKATVMLRWCRVKHKRFVSSKASEVSPCEIKIFIHLIYSRFNVAMDTIMRPRFISSKNHKQTILLWERAEPRYTNFSLCWNLKPYRFPTLRQTYSCFRRLRISLSRFLKQPNEDMLCSTSGSISSLPGMTSVCQQKKNKGLCKFDNP